MIITIPKKINSQVIIHIIPTSDTFSSQLTDLLNMFSLIDSLYEVSDGLIVCFLRHQPEQIFDVFACSISKHIGKLFNLCVKYNTSKGFAFS